MTLATLNYIHALLKHEEEAQRNAKHLAFQSLEKAEQEKADNITDLRELLRKVRASYDEANTALRDFEAQEW